MTMPSNDALKEVLLARLSQKKYLHSLGVADTAKELAEHYGYDPDKAYLTGLLHDYAKKMSAHELIEIAQKHELTEDMLELNMMEVLHAPVGAYLVEQELKVYDPEILQAIRRHTLGATDMSLLDEIIYVADMIEPNRSFPELLAYRKAAFENLALGVVMGVNSSIVSCLEKNKLIHPRSLNMRNQYIEKRGEHLCSLNR